MISEIFEKDFKNANRVEELLLPIENYIIYECFCVSWGVEKLIIISVKSTWEKKEEGGEENSGKRKKSE